MQKERVMSTIHSNLDSLGEERLTQISSVLKHLKERKTTTSWEAIEYYKITRLADIIFNLRREYFIDTEMIYATRGKRYARYHFHGEKP